MLIDGFDPLSQFRFDAAAPLLVALSGGGDSMALLRLLHRRLPGRLIAATVDHGLRPDSAREAEAAGAACRALGVDHFILTWTGVKPSSGVQAAARLARHRLLVDLAEAQGCAAVAVGHTEDDQLETILMRGARGAGRGFAGIAPATLCGRRVWFVRPLLELRRAVLRDYLREAGQDWAEDPSNADMRFERVRARRQAAELTVRERGALLAQARREGELRMQLSADAARLIGAYASSPAPGLIRLDAALLDAGRQAAIHALGVVLASAGGTPHLPPPEKVAGLLDRLAGGARRASLSRAVVDRRAGGIYVLREKRNLPAENAGEIWDGRFEAQDEAPAPAAGDAPRSLLNHAAATLPPGGFAPVVAPWADFLPAFDFEAARATGVVLGAEALPAPPLDLPSGPPWRGHIGPSA